VRECIHPDFGKGVLIRVMAIVVVATRSRELSVETHMSRRTRITLAVVAVCSLALPDANQLRAQAAVDEG
jgi:hypothetical protein